MRRSFIFMLGLLCLVIMVTYMHTADAAGHRHCCTAFSRVRPQSLMRVKGTVRCRWQGITEGCNINAVVVTVRRRQMCVNPRARKMRNVLLNLCNNATGKTGQRQQRTANG